MYTVKTMCAYLDISHTGLHSWAERYSKYLSEAANDANTARQFTDNDAAVLWTVKALRDQNISHDDIKKRLADGYQAEPPHTPDDLPQLPAVARSEADKLQLVIGRLHEQIDVLQDQLTTAHDEIKALRGQVAILKETLKELYREKGKS